MKPVLPCEVSLPSSEKILANHFQNVVERRYYGSWKENGPEEEVELLGDMALLK